MAELETARTLSKRLSISERQIWKLLAAGKFPEPIRLGRSVRWPTVQIDDWIAQQSESAQRQAVQG
jgi:predicted DNA-binding transcriptional regulator AlpA